MDTRGEQGSIQALEAFAWEGRAIMLVDLDAFFASVEQLDHPGWRGKPVIVGGSPDRRGVVSTASYEARKFGVHSAMASSVAARLCPDAIWTEGHYSRYREMSNAVMSILADETPHVQQVSIDEAFLDVSPTRVNTEHPVSIARRIQQRVSELGVTCSIGLGTTKAIAKLASDMDKPRGLTVVIPGSERRFMAPLPVGELSGIGKASARKLRDVGILTLGDLADADDELVESLLGKTGLVMLARARGEEDDAIVTDDEVKSVSNEMSFARDLTERDEVEAAIATTSQKVARRLRRKGLTGHTVAVKVRYADLSVRSAQRPLESGADDGYVLERTALSLLDELWAPGIALRLVGVAVSKIVDAADEGAGEQLSLFDDRAEETARDSRGRNLQRATDKVKERFGESAIRLGSELKLAGIDTGTTSKNPADYK